MKNIKIIFLIIIFSLTALSCIKTDNINYAALTKNMNFPSAGDTPTGNDAISSSTNHSGKEEYTTPNLNPYSGAAFVQAPQINNYGSVSLNYPIVVPEGRTGIQPVVGISYSSSSGDGLLGIGWNLTTGLGVISRTTSNGEIYYDHRDTFTYNGKRLVKVEGSLTSENGTYRLEIESAFSRFELENIENGGIWRVYDKDGNVSIYGEDTSSRIYHPKNQNKTYTWNFSKNYDLNGNNMYAEYDTSEYHENHILYLKEIRYTGNYDENVKANQYVRFTYKKRSDPYVSKAAGFIMKMDRLLDVVEVGWDNPAGWTSTELWRYEMVYETSSESGRPLLKTVESTKNSTTPEFIYQPALHHFVWQNVDNDFYNSPEINPESTKYFEGDFNGDGISDMVFFNPETGEWRAAQGIAGGGYTFPIYGNKFKGYSSESKIQFFKGNVTGDYNGDSRSDIAFYLPETKEFWVAEHNGKVFEFQSYGRLYIDIDIFKCEWFTGDYDGNGLSDVVLFNEPTGEWIFMRNMGSSFEFIKFSQHFKNLFRDDYNPDINMDSNFTADQSEHGKHRDKIHFLSGDYNGDGRTDISIYDARNGRWWVASTSLGTGDKTGFNLEWALYKEFTLPEQVLFSNDRFSGDFNGDGFSDFLLFNRSTGEWIIGETGDGTINFRIFSKTPEFREITRWLQGDFNGDGRTDIGFFSMTDRNFWIGEATKEGFRYRIYNNLEYCSDPGRILAAPLPMDEVKLEQKKILLSKNAGTALIEYQFDNNFHTNRGEKVFSGNFTSAGDLVPEFLIYNRAENRVYFKRGQSTLTTAIPELDLDSSNIQLLNNEKPAKYRDNDGILYYKKESSLFGGENHSFNLFHSTNSGFRNETIAKFDSSTINFSIDQSFYLVDQFSEDQYRYPLILDDAAENSHFVLFRTYNNPEIIHISESDIGLDFFRNIRSRGQSLRFFSGKFTDDTRAQVLIVDMADTAHKWYLGTINGDSISFVMLNGTPHLYAQEKQNDLHYHISNGELIYSTISDNRIRFYKLDIFGIGTYSIAQSSFNPLGQGVTFNYEYDIEGNPLVYDGSVIKKVIFGATGYTLVTINPVRYSITRPDLMIKIYPFNWIQGDYNGDGKTDLGFFHLKEKKWYFLATEGTVPDLINEVKNGIGGTYKIEYINSTTLDNRGDDGIPHLPMNYKVCSKLTVQDGLGSSITSYYGYKKGYAFSGFINGKKEADYFGFGEFTVTDILGNRTVSYYHNVPFEDFRKNRALAGAIKGSLFHGNDRVEYARTEYEYKLHEIVPNTNPKVSSFLIEPVKVQKFMKGTLVETRESNILLESGKYEMNSKRESVTDHYEDGIHSALTVSNYSEFNNIASTNEMRLILQKNFDNTAHETTSQYDYDSKGNLIEERIKYTGTGLPSVTDKVMNYEYDDYGNRIKEINASGTPARIVERTIDTLLHQYVVQEKAIGDSITLSTNYTINFESAFGAVSVKQDPNGSNIYFDYDNLGRLYRQRIDTESGVATLNTYSYNAQFPLSAKVTQNTGTSDLETRVYADGMGRTIHSVSSASGESGKKYVKSGKIVYDAIGRVIRKSQTDWADESEIDEYKPIKSEKHPTATEYDSSGRVKKITMPQGYAGEAETSMTFTYNDPWEVIETHSVGRTKRTVKNTRGQVLYIEDSGIGDDGQAVNAKIGFAYNIAGARIKKMDLNNASMTLDVPPAPMSPLNPGASLKEKDQSGNNIAYWWYNGFGQVIASNDSDLGYSGVEYNSFGDISASVDALDKVTTMTYDRLGRLTVKHLPGTEGEVHYVYDTQAGSDYALGRVVAIDDPSQNKKFSYDRIGRVKKETREIKIYNGGVPVPGDQYITDFGYDLLNRKTSIQYPTDPNSGNRITTTYEYCAMGVKGIKINNGSVTKDIVQNISYNEFGQMTDIIRGNNTSTHYEYDIKGRLTNLVTTTENNGSVRKLQDVSYTFKVDNSIASVENRPNIDVQGAYLSVVKYDYKYDGLNRLIHAAGSFAKGSLPNTDPVDMMNRFERGYRYAKNGNLMGKDIFDPETHSIDDRWDYSYNNHAVTSITSTKLGSTRFLMEYDSAGNMITQRDNQKNLVKEMAYDSFNRIKQVTNPENGNLIGEYWYDDQGFRVRKLARTEVDGQTRETEILYPSMYFAVEKQRTLDGVIVPNTESSVNNVYLNGVRIAAVLPNASAKYYLTDQIDSVKVVVDDQGLALSKIEYLPYGETWFEEGDTNNAPKYNSQELDKETGYYFYNARHYDPEVSRFVTADNVIDGELDTQGWNRFAYCHGNPVIYKDPTGHEIITPDYSFVAIAKSLWEVGKAFFGGNQTKKDAENTLNKANDKISKLKKGDISPSGNGVITDILEYKISGKYPNDNPGKVFITDSNKEPNTKFWKQFKEKLEHWYDEKINPKTKKPILTKVDSLKMFDISDKKRGGESDFYGPNKEFKIIRAGLSGGYGGRIDIKVNGKISTLGHFSEISSKVIEAAKTGKSLPAGTYLGVTRTKIGSSSGPHLHGQGSEHRNKILESYLNEKKE